MTLAVIFCAGRWPSPLGNPVFIDVNKIKSVTFERLSERALPRHAGWVCQIDYTVTTAAGSMDTWVRRECWGWFSFTAFLGAFVEAYRATRRRASILRECCYFDGVPE